MKKTGILAVTAAAAIAVTALSVRPQVEGYDLIIMNGRIVDGTGNPWYIGDVAIRGDRIVKVGRVAPARARRRIDAEGLVVAPGFIDMLGHSEMNLLVDPRAESKLLQGITTEVTGEGESAAPMNDYIIKERESFFRRFEIAPDWRTLGEYFGRLDRAQPAINLATYVGAAQVRKYVLKDEDRPPTPEELARMRGLVAAAMEDGAVGISTSLIYAPGFYAKTEELIELAKVAARYGGIYATHMRNESSAIFEALDEAIRIGREARIPVEVFHLKVAGRQNWGRMPEVIKKIESARAAGIDIAADQYPYVAGATALGASVPPWAHEDGTERLLERLRDPATRDRLKREMRAPAQSWENLYHGSGGGKGILITGTGNRDLSNYEGKRLSEVAEMMGKDDELDALFDLVIADNDQTRAVYFMMSEDDVRLALKLPWVSVGVDYGAVSTTGPLAEGKVHPRAYGSFPRILSRYVREEGLLTLEEAIRKMTSLAAGRARLANRGLLAPGFFADVVVFDQARIRDEATFEDPNRPSVGVRFVVVNGVIALSQGRLVPVRSGRALKGPGYAGKRRTTGTGVQDD